jgi:nitrile hydratase
LEALSDKFRVGDTVRVRQENPGGNPRTPTYVRGKKGSIVAIHGVIDNPIDHRGLYSPLYTVMFDMEEVSGRPSDEKLCVDVHEEWLEEV